MSQSNENNKQIGQWLSEQEIEREDDSEENAQKLFEHTSDNVNKIENDALCVIESYMDPQEYSKLKQNVDDNGLLGV